MTGNHEAWIGEQYEELEQKILNAGVVILHDSSVNLTRGNETIQLVSLDDPDFTGSGSSIQESMSQIKLEEMDLTGTIAYYCPIDWKFSISTCLLI